MNFIVGVSGGIGSGKSCAAKFFQDVGARLVDTDAISHELTQAGGEAMPLIKTVFGDHYLLPDGSLNRVVMRQRIFSEAMAKKQLEAILHPLIFAHSQRQCQAQTSAPYVLLAVPLLAEATRYRNTIHRVLLIDAEESIRCARVMARSGLSQAETYAIINAQASREAQLALADDVIQNNGTLQALEHAVLQKHAQYLALAENF